MRRALDRLAFASLIPAGVAPLLLLVAGKALGQPPRWLAAATGTLFVYGLDRLRGVAANRGHAPARTRFVERHRGPLLAATTATGIVAAGLVLALPPDGQLLCAAVTAAGLLHRRLGGRIPTCQLAALACYRNEERSAGPTDLRKKRPRPSDSTPPSRR